MKSLLIFIIFVVLMIYFTVSKDHFQMEEGPPEDIYGVDVTPVDGDYLHEFQEAINHANKLSIMPGLDFGMTPIDTALNYGGHQSEDKISYI